MVVKVKDHRRQNALVEAEDGLRRAVVGAGAAGYSWTMIGASEHALKPVGNTK